MRIVLATVLCLGCSSGDSEGAVAADTGASEASAPSDLRAPDAVAPESGPSAEGWKKAFHTEYPFFTKYVLAADLQSLSCASSTNCTAKTPCD